MTRWACCRAATSRVFPTTMVLMTCRAGSLAELGPSGMPEPLESEGCVCVWVCVWVCGCVGVWVCVGMWVVVVVVVGGTTIVWGGGRHPRRWSKGRLGESAFLCFHRLCTVLLTNTGLNPVATPLPHPQEAALRLTSAKWALPPLPPHNRHGRM